MLSVGIFAQTVTGVVTSDDGPLPGATVLVQGTNDFATTDFDGNYIINNVEPGDYTIDLSYIGYGRISQTITVGGDDAT